MIKHVYPPRHPASLDAPTGPRGNAADPAPAHEPAESAQDHAAPQPRTVDRTAQRDATRGGPDSDRGAATDPLGNDADAPHRGLETPPR